MIFLIIGEDYDRKKLLNLTAIDAERLERKKKKKNPDQGFSDFEAATHRQYNRQVFTIYKYSSVRLY